MIKVATNILIVTAFSAALVFVARYLRTRWFTRAAGRVAMALLASTLLLLGLIVATTWFGRDYPFRAPIRLVAYFGVNIMLWRAVWLLFRDQRRMKEALKR